MFPYSFGVQAATKEKAKSDIAAQVDALSEKHPDDAKTYAPHLSAVLATAGVLIDLLPQDDPVTDVAVSAAGHLHTKNLPADDEGKVAKVVQSASVHVAADRRPTDASKYEKPRKSAKRDALGEKVKEDPTKE
jgi:hypothetical protein